MSLKSRNDGRSRVFLLLSAFCFLLLIACTRSTPTAALPPPPAPVPAPAAVVEPVVKTPTLDEVRSLRTNNQLDLYEAGLKTLSQSPDAQISSTVVRYVWKAASISARGYWPMNGPYQQTRTCSTSR